MGGIVDWAMFTDWVNCENASRLFFDFLVGGGEGGGGEEEERGPSCGMLTVTVFEVLTGGNVATVDD